MIETILTEFIKTKPVRKALDRCLEYPPRSKPPPLLARVSDTEIANYDMIGRAYDVWVRCSAIAQNRLGRSRFRELFEYRFFIKQGYAVNPEANVALKLHLDALDRYYEQLTAPSDRVLEACLFLSLFSAEFRTGVPVFSFEVADFDLEALKKIAAISELSWLKGKVVLSPEFGVEGSNGFIAADGDIMVGNTLFEIKTLREFRPRETIRQLIGYYVLNFLIKPQYNIKSVALFYARFNHLLKLRVYQLITPEQTAEVAALFRRYLGKRIRRIRDI